MNNPIGVVLVDNHLISTYLSQLIVCNATKQIILKKTLIQYTQNREKFVNGFLIQRGLPTNAILGFILKITRIRYI